MSLITIPQIFFSPTEINSSVFWGVVIALTLAILCLITWKEPAFLRRKDRTVHTILSLTIALVLMYIIPVAFIAQLAFITGTSNVGLGVLFFGLLCVLFVGIISTAIIHLQLLPGAHIPKAYQIEKVKTEFFKEIHFENSVFRTRVNHVLNNQKNLFEKEKQLPDVITTFYDSEAEKIKSLDFGTSALSAISALGNILAPIPRKKEGDEYFKSRKGKALIALSKKRVSSLHMHLKEKFDEETLVEDILKKAEEKVTTHKHPRVYKAKIAQAKKAYSTYKSSVREIIIEAQKAFTGKEKLQTRIKKAEKDIENKLLDFELLCEHLIDSIHALGYEAYKIDPVFRGEGQKSLNRKK